MGKQAPSQVETVWPGPWQRV